MPDRAPDLQIADAIGRMMAFWGFRKNLGRIWALLYLHPEALTAPDLCERLGLSAGSVSMALTELQRWGAVHKRTVPGDRRDHYEAEQDIWGTVASVMERREVQQIDQTLASFATAEADLDAELAEAEASGDAEELAALRWRRGRVAELEELAHAGRDLLGLLLGQLSPAELTQQEEPVRRAPLRIPRAPRED